MSFMISLCHFCDIHGPSVLMTCSSDFEKEKATSEDDASNTNKASSANEKLCEACHMPEKYMSIESETGRHYTSCQLPTQQPLLTTWLNHVCVRSLSCEVNPCIFSEPPHCALSVSFSVRDAQARGFHHWLSVVVCAKDLSLLAASWQFFNRHINNVVTWLQDKATQVYNLERPFRSDEPSQPRPLPKLVKYKAVYARLHYWFSWMIHAGQSRMYEVMPRSPYYKFEPRHVFEEGNLKSLRVFLGAPVFDLAALFVLEGRQVIVRGDIPALVEATVNTLKSLLPGDWCKALTNSDMYLEPSECGLLGVSTQVAVPTPCQDIVRVDLVQGCVSSKTTASMTQKCPTLVTKLVKALGSELLREKALAYQLQVFFHEWCHIAKLAHITRSQNNKLLLTSLGVKPQDEHLLAYWSKNWSNK